MIYYVIDEYKENKLKIFRWKLLHFILPCKQLLYQWKIENTPLCDTCHIIDDYEHYFISCKNITRFYIYLVNYSLVVFSWNFHAYKELYWF
jgi:hypothetical protein